MLCCYCVPQYVLHFQVRKKYIHPNFQFRATQPDRYDVALLELVTEAGQALHIMPICLPRNDLQLEGKNAVVAGWGKVKPSNELLGTNVLRSARVPILGAKPNYSTCPVLIFYPFQIYKNAPNGTTRSKSWWNCTRKCCVPATKTVIKTRVSGTPEVLWSSWRTADGRWRELQARDSVVESHISREFTTLCLSRPAGCGLS